MLSAAALIAAARQADGSLSCAVPQEWLQGRTAFGGFSTAIACHAARGAAQDLPALRAAQIAFVGPVAGDMHARATLLRRGKSSAFVAAQLSSGGQLAMQGTFLFMSDRDSGLRIAAPAAPAAPAPEDARPAMRGKGPAFWQQMDYRHAAPPGERAEAELLRWVRLRSREGLDPVTELLLVGDALPPAVSPLLQGPFVASSALWSLHLHGSAIATHDGWWLVRTRAESAGDGIASQAMTVWNRAGEAVLSGSQTVSFFPAAG